MQEKTAVSAKNEKCEYAGVYLLDIPFSADRMYDYYIPTDLRNVSVPGAFVVVPFGGGNRKQNGVIFELHDKVEFSKVKPILKVSDDSSPLTEEQLHICKYLVNNTLCTYGDAVRTVKPSGAAKSIRMYRITEKAVTGDGGELSQSELLAYEYIKCRNGIKEELFASHFGANAESLSSALLSGKYIELVNETADQSLRYEKVYSSAVTSAEKESLKSGGRVGGMKRKLTLPSQLSVLDVLENESMTERELLQNIKGLTAQQLSTMVANKIIGFEYKEAFRDPVFEKNAAVQPLIPSEEQSAALKTLKSLASDGKPHGALLYGVTGSGKTTVILGMIDDCLERGKGAIVLLPEIALTPQMLGVFCSRYGQKVAVMHSALSNGERYDAYTRVKRGIATIVVGTRSAVFAPVKDLGMIVIDEEQEHTYKSDMNPKYHARDIARMRCADNNALMLLSSATPSVESYKKAKEGVYTLIKLTKRYGTAVLPTVTIADMRKEAHGGNISPLGEDLSRALIETNSKGEQSILFLNRRGYNTFVSCVDCGEAIKCPSCSVAMTYHTKKGSYEKGELVCHWCGRRMQIPDECPSCKSTHLSRCGFGTQKVEQELTVLLPDANVMRMDSDTTSQKTAYDRLIGAFRENGDVLLGTQMVTKGHDFPRVTLVGVLLADMSLYLDDYRANERTFALLTQVIGRAGRADRAGHAIIQTNNPDNDIIKLACLQDYESFYEDEIRLRKLLVFPPFCDIVLLTVSHTDERELETAVHQLGMMMKDYLNGEFSDVAQVTFGPFEAPIYKVDDRYRRRFVIKCKLNNKTKKYFETVMRKFGTEFNGPRKPQLSVDLNPTNL